MGHLQAYLFHSFFSSVCIVCCIKDKHSLSEQVVKRKQRWIYYWLTSFDLFQTASSLWSFESPFFLFHVCSIIISLEAIKQLFAVGMELCPPLLLKDNLDIHTSLDPNESFKSWSKTSVWGQVFVSSLRWDFWSFNERKLVWYLQWPEVCGWKQINISIKVLLNKVRMFGWTTSLYKNVYRGLSSALFLWQHRTDYNPTRERRMMRIFNMSLSNCLQALRTLSWGN